MREESSHLRKRGRVGGGGRWDGNLCHVPLLAADSAVSPVFGTSPNLTSPRLSAISCTTPARTHALPLLSLPRAPASRPITTSWLLLLLPRAIKVNHPHPAPPRRRGVARQAGVTPHTAAAAAGNTLSQQSDWLRVLTPSLTVLAQRASLSERAMGASEAPFHAMNR